MGHSDAAAAVNFFISPQLRSKTSPAVMLQQSNSINEHINDKYSLRNSNATTIATITTSAFEYDINT